MDQNNNNSIMNIDIEQNSKIFNNSSGELINS